MKKRTTKISMLMSIVILLSFLMTVPVFAETAKSVKKVSPTFTKSVAEKNAYKVTKGTVRLKISQGGYIKFTAPKAGKYNFTFSGLSSGSGYASFMKSDSAKTIAYVGNSKVVTKGGKSSTLWICSKSFASFYKNQALRVRPIPTRTGTISLKKGECVYMYISTGSTSKVTLKIAQKK